MPRTRCWLALASILLCVAACGGEQASTASPTPPSPSASASKSPAPGKVFTFKLNPADSSVTSKGTITLTAGPNSTTVELKITGLQASSSHISHIHLGSCTGRGGIAFALNQVRADGQGNADTQTTIGNATYPPTGPKWYAVVHSGPDMQGTNSKYLLCGNLF
jgi:hypothetical protein